MDGEKYDITFNIRDKGKEQYQYVIEFRNKNKETVQNSHTVTSNLRHPTGLSLNNRVPQNGQSVNSNSMRISQKDASKSKIMGVKAAEARIEADMDESRRAKILKNMKLNVVETSGKILKLSEEEITTLENKCKSKAEKILIELCEKAGIFRGDYTNENIKIEFNYSKGSLRESVFQQNKRNPYFYDIAKLYSVFDDVVKNAQLIESHTDKYKETKRFNPNLKQSYVMLGCFKSGEFIIPVELNIKEFKKTVKNRLYMSITLKKIRADILAPYDETSQRNGTPSALEYSITDIIKNVNPEDGDFVRYIPDELLSDEQIISKRQTVKKKKMRSWTVYAIAT